MYKRLRLTNCDSPMYETLEKNLKNYNSILQRNINVTKKIYYESKFNKYMYVSNIKQTWTTINELLNKCNNTLLEQETVSKIINKINSKHSCGHDDILTIVMNKANLRDLIAATGLVISNWIQIVNFSTRVTVKFDGWPQKAIGHFFYTTSSFVHHFKSIGEFKLDLQSRNAQFGSKLVICYPVWPWNLMDDLGKQ